MFEQRFRNVTNDISKNVTDNELGMLQIMFKKTKICGLSKMFFINVYGNDVCNVLERLFITFIKMLQTTFYEYYIFKPSSNVFKTFLKYRIVCWVATIFRHNGYLARIIRPNSSLKNDFIFMSISV